MRLSKTDVITITPTSPFNFDATFHKPDHFTSGDNIWQQGIRWQTWFWRDVPLGLKFINTGSINKPQVTVEVFSEPQLSESYTKSLKQEIIYRYNLNLDLKPFYKQFAKDKTLSPVIEKWKGMRPGHPSSLYEYLIIGIILQNATIKRSVQMFQALLENYGRLLNFDSKELWCFWKEGGLHNISELELRQLKVGYRAKYIKKIDDYFYEGKIDELSLRTRTLDEQRERLLNLYGVGPATVWYILFDVFHHWDFFNHVSPWEQKIYSKIFFNRETNNPVPVSRILKYFERFGKYKQLAVHYIWENLWWERKNKHIPWLEKEIRL